VLSGLLEVREIIEGGSQVEMAFRTLLIEFESLHVDFDGFLESVLHVVSIAQVVESRSILRIYFKSLLIRSDGVLVLLLDAQSIAQVVVGLRLLGVQADC
jgi:hypothetical protein